MQKTEDLLKKLIAHCKEYGFVFPSSEIYDGLSATYDYGPLGVELKNNLKNYWWTNMVRLHDNIVGIDAAIFMHPTTWKASGHVDAFNDPMIDNKDSKKRYRADVLLEEYLQKLEQKIETLVEKGRKKFDHFDETLFLSTNVEVLRYQQEKKSVEEQLQKALNDNNLQALKQLIEDLKIVCPVSGTTNWTEVRQFNLMFSTEMGSMAEAASTLYLRPETAQGIFVNFLNVQKSARMKIPFGIAQIGKAFRNEIIARQFIFRMREFEQMEMQFFVAPEESQKWYHYWKEQRMQWHKNLGFNPANYRFHDHIKLSHYADAACDIEFNFPMGFKELEGIHSRTDFDLKAHEAYSGKKIKYFDPATEQSYTPYVIETSVGLDRLFLSVLTNSYQEETLEDGSLRTVLKLPLPLAPIQLAVLPLLKKEELMAYATKIFKDLSLDFACQFDAKDAIGRRYRRQDAIGTPFCLTVDHQTLEDHTVTLRERDTMIQHRISIAEVEKMLKNSLSLKRLFDKI